MILTGLITRDDFFREELSRLLSDRCRLLNFTDETVRAPGNLEGIDLFFLDLPVDRGMLELLGLLLSEKPELTVICFLDESDQRLAPEVSALGAYEVLSRNLADGQAAGSIRNALERSRLLAEKRTLERCPELTGQPPGTAGEPAAGRNLYQTAFPRFAGTLARVFDAGEFWNSLAATLAETFGLSRVALFLEESGRFRFQAGTGWDPELSEQIDFDSANPLVKRLISERQLVTRWEIDRLPVPAAEAGAIRRELSLLQAWLCIPLFWRGRVNGFIALGNKVRGGGFTEAELELAVFLTSYLGLMAENVRLYHRISRSKREQEMVFRDLAAGVIAADREGRIFTFNDRASEILRLPKAEVVGQAIQRTGSQLADLFWRTLRETDAEPEKKLVYQPTATPLQVHASLLHDENERVEGVVIVLLDLTEKERLENKVRELERLNYWYQLAGSMAHQIKNPLVSIKTFVQLFPEKYRDPEFRDNFFKIVNREVERLNEIIAELFEFSEPGALHLQPCPLNEILAEVIRRAETEGGPRISPPAENEEKAWLNADRDRLVKAFGCLVENAREAVRKNKNGLIEIRTLPARLESGPALLIQFRDNGSGIAPGRLEEVFSPFYTTKTKGMGLGLPICRRIVQEHGGIIEIESRPGHGTTGSVTLPVLTGRS